MAITLGNLCKYARENYDMKVVCGEKNMNNIVNWVHTLEDPETASFLHGKELIITTGIGYDNTDWFVDFVKELSASDVSALVLNIGPYIKKVPQELIDYCNKVQFPLLTIPWKTRIVDITNDFCRQIIKDEKIEGTVAGAFRNSIFLPDGSDDYMAVLERNHFDMEANFTVVALSYECPTQEKVQQYDKNIRMYLTRRLIEHGEKFSIFGIDKNLIIVLQNYEDGVVKDILLYINNAHAYNIRTGVSSQGMGIGCMQKNYRRAIAVLDIAKKQEQESVFYQDIGLYKLLIEVDDNKVLKKYYDSTLGVLEDYDNKNDSNYVDTLKYYLDNNSSVEKVAKIMFTHRNTINYKIRKIKEILGIELTYEDGVHLLLAFRIKDFL